MTRSVTAQTMFARVGVCRIYIYWVVGVPRIDAIHFPAIRSGK